ncbi:MAG: homocysteine S-methyltransferase family protein [Parvularcula sp.]|jgi:homocysteine S-methyltransferase|nr:homocysteine S-methyltransferase family protein [Parvularcula sp.]
MHEPSHRNCLPQLGGGFFLTDAGIETDLIFNRGFDLPCFASHTLFDTPDGRAGLEDYFRGYIELAREFRTGLILDTATWRAQPHWADDLGQSLARLQEVNEQAVAMAVALRDDADLDAPIVINAPIAPRGDAYRPDTLVGVDEARQYFAQQLGWLANTAIDMVTALTFNQIEEAAGFVLAASDVGLPAVVSFTVETDGRLPSGPTLQEAIEKVDSITSGSPAYFMVNCAHPEHFPPLNSEETWVRRVHGFRANASRLSHAELDESTDLHIGDPEELANLHMELLRRLPWINVVGGCCGCDVRHIAAIARARRREFLA